YRVAVPAGASAGTGGIDFPAATTDLRTHVAALGGIAPATDGDGAYRAQYRDNYTGLQRWSGSSWVGIACDLIPWTKASLASGYGHDGNNNGDVRYRVIDLIGTRFVQWRGGMNVKYSGGLPAHDGKFLARPLPATARPSSGLRTVPVACSAGDSSILSLKVDFYANGTADLLNDPGDTPPWVSLNGIMYPL
ncbi:hypothetical protein G5C65_37285, partial [Streptomyces sp. SB3404]|nr:hypothetical protein [Streptomyces boncukensis]